MNRFIRMGRYCFGSPVIFVTMKWERKTGRRSKDFTQSIRKYFVQAVGLTMFRIITVVVPIVVIVCKLIMLNGNCCNKFLYIYRTARYLCSSVRFTPETFVSGVFLLSKKIVIQQYLSLFGFTCPSRGTMV